MPSRAAGRVTTAAQRSAHPAHPSAAPAGRRRLVGSTPQNRAPPQQAGAFLVASPVPRSGGPGSAGLRWDPRARSRRPSARRSGDPVDGRAGGHRRVAQRRRRGTRSIPRRAPAGYVSQRNADRPQRDHSRRRGGMQREPAGRGAVSGSWWRGVASQSHDRLGRGVTEIHTVRCQCAIPSPAALCHGSTLRSSRKLPGTAARWQDQMRGDLNGEDRAVRGRSRRRDSRSRWIRGRRDRSGRWSACRGQDGCGPRSRRLLDRTACCWFLRP